MFRVLGIVFGLGLLATPAQPQEMPAQIPWANKFFVKDQPPPVIVHDFGVLPKGTIATHRFVMENIYAVPVQIMGDPQVSCGCVSILRYSPKLESREKGYIDVQIDARKFEGNKIVTIKVNFGPKYISQAVLQVRAFCRADVMMNPGQIAFGIVPQGQQPTQFIDIHYTGKQNDWQIREVINQDAPVDVSVKQLSRNRIGAIYRMTATLKKDAPAGQLQEQVFLQTNDPSSPTLAVAITGMIQSPLSSAQGTEIKLDPVAVGQTTSRKMILKAEKPFRILRVEGEGDGLTVDFNKAPTPLPVQFLTINFKPNQAGQLNRELLIRTDHKDVVQKIQIQAIATEGP